MEGGSGSESVRGNPSVSATGRVRVSERVRETGFEREVVLVEWIGHVKLSPELKQALVESCLCGQQVPQALTLLYEK